MPDDYPQPPTEPSNDRSSEPDFPDESPVVGHEIEFKREAQAQGWIGKFLGGQVNLPGNLMALIAIFLVLMLPFFVFRYPETQTSVLELVKFSLSLSLGFFCGRKVP